MIENNFYLNFNLVKVHDSIAKIDDELDVWHKKFDHINLKPLKFIQGKFEMTNLDKN